MAENQGKTYLKAYLDKTDMLFEDYLEKKIVEAAAISKVPAELLRRFLETARRGKKIRGGLVTLGYQAAGGKNEAAILDASLSIELFHAAILVHDDIMDQDDLRRGLATLHKQFEEIGESLHVKGSSAHYGESMAINVGDAGLYMAWDQLLKSDFPAERLVEAGQIFADYVLRVVHGQILDITTTSIHHVTEDDVLKVHQYKAAEYTGVLPLLLGSALASPVTPDKRKAIYDYGVAFGWAFQLQDDLLGMFGDVEKVGKPIGSDLREGKNTLLVLHLAQHGTTEQKRVLRHLLGNPNITQADVEKLREMLKQAGSYQYVVDLGWNYVKQGQAAIPNITDNVEIQTILSALISYMMERVV